MKFKRLTHARKLSGRLYDALEEMILDGDLKTSDRLPTEAVLCDKLGVSRTSLREALQQLKGRGVIESVAGRGMFVRSIEQTVMEKEMRLFAQVEQDPEAFFELVELRLMIEPELAAKTAKNVTPEFTRDLDALIMEMRANTDNLSGFMEADLDMHLRIATEAGNRFSRIILSCLKPLNKRFGRFSHHADNLVHTTLQEHKRIVEAIREGNSRRARKAMRDHLLASKEYFGRDYKKP